LEADVRIFVQSFGGEADWYNTDAEEMDSFAHLNQEFLFVVSSGNDGVSGKLHPSIYYIAKKSNDRIVE
jgi:hypothetical protein